MAFPGTALQLEQYSHQVMSLTKVAVFCAVYSLALWWRYGRYTLAVAQQTYLLLNDSIPPAAGLTLRGCWFTAIHHLLAPRETSKRNQRKTN